MNSGIKAVLIFGIIVGITIGGTVAYRVLDKPEEVAQTNAMVSLAPSATPAPGALSGSFVNVDTIHKGSGTARVVKSGDNAVLQLQNFSVTDGPDLYVYLTKNANVEQDKKTGEFVSLGRLKSIKGEQTYTLPADYADYKGVIIWCRAFTQPFTVASLKSI